ncbi:kirola-like [Bidens hawaiensis]|uniref:kirola-like n=1 Tax=Bidens hawaiensis TaxID=980011 RepID=UPI00404A1299
MGLSGKKVIPVDIKCNGDVLHGLFRYRLSDLLILAPEYLRVVSYNKVNGVQWDPSSTGTMYSIYKTFKASVQVNGTGDNSTVTWTLEYEKMNEDIPDPDSLVEAVQNITKFVETRLNPDSLVGWLWTHVSPCASKYSVPRINFVDYVVI